MEKPYTNLPLEGPHDVAVGHALLTMVEPRVGHERSFNRWYEDDHIFSGALFLPWLFSGRRWVATYDLQQLRYPKESPISSPVTKGCFFSTYWITPGRIKEHKEWSYSVYARLSEEKRVNDNRDHVFTAFQDKAGTVYRDQTVPNEVFSLMDPAVGLVLEVVDAPTPERRDDLEKWLLGVYLPARVTDNKLVSSAMVFRTAPPDPNINAEVLERIGKIHAISNDQRRLTILWFLEKDPREVWEELFVPEGSMVADGGLGEVALVAPFIPAKMGTNTYDDQLRAPSEM